MLVDDVAKQYFPIDLPGDVVGKVVDKKTVFAVGEATAIFDPAALGHYQPPAVRQEQASHLVNACVPSGQLSIAFYDSDDAPVGWFWGYMEYADTFTIDTFGLVPAYRGRGIYGAFTRSLLDYLTAIGYERVTVITHPNNRAMLIANLKVGFCLVGMENREDGGAMVKLAYILHADRRIDFSSAFRMLPEA